MLHLINTFFAAMTFGSAAYAIDLPGLPNLTEDEVAMYEPIKANQKKVDEFIASRKFFRKAALNKLSVTKKDTIGLRTEYAVDFTEQMLYIEVLSRLGLSSSYA
jgi:hypothetical protein